MAFNVHGNTFGKTTKTFGGSVNVWHEIKGAYPIGGLITLTNYNLGTVIPAGSMVILDQANHAIEVITAAQVTAASAEGTSEAKTAALAKLAQVNGLLKEDVYVDEAAKGTNGAATGTVVFAGEIYIDRCKVAVPSSVLAQLPQIVAIKEK